MTIRKRDDSVKSGRGIDGDLGEDFVKPGPDQFTGYPGQRSREYSYAGHYTENKSGLVQGEEAQVDWATRDITDLVESNQNPGGEFDTTGAVRAGVSRSQKDGEKKGGAR